MKRRIKERIVRRKIYERLLDESPPDTLPGRKLLLAITVAAAFTVPPFVLSVIYAFGE